MVRWKYTPSCFWKIEHICNQYEYFNPREYIFLEALTEIALRIQWNPNMQLISDLMYRLSVCVYVSL